MSAFVVSRQHIRYLVNAAMFLGNDHDFGLRWSSQIMGFLAAGDDGGAVRVGQMLWDENIKSVKYRYPDSRDDDLPGPVGEDFVYRSHDLIALPKLAALQALKAADCYEYQSCEHPEWKTSEAKVFIEALRRKAITNLPGYEDAKWEIA